jgi:hypothetical protein
MTALDQFAKESHPVTNLPPGFENARVWEATAPGKVRELHVVAIFNLDDKPATYHATWAQLGITGKHGAIDQWDGKTLKPSETVDVTLPAHGCVLYRVD